MRERRPRLTHAAYLGFVLNPKLPNFIEDLIYVF